MATTTCSAVTIEVGERNHAVPLMPCRLEAALLSSSSKYLEMLTVERVSAAGATHSATARVQGTSRTSRDNNQGRIASRTLGASRRNLRAASTQTLSPCIAIRPRTSPHPRRRIYGTVTRPSSCFVCQDVFLRRLLRFGHSRSTAVTVGHRRRTARDRRRRTPAARPR